MLKDTCKTPGEKLTIQTEDASGNTKTVINSSDEAIKLLDKIIQLMIEQQRGVDSLHRKMNNH